MRRFRGPRFQICGREVVEFSPLVWGREARQGISQNIDAEVSSWVPLAPARKGFEDLLAVLGDIAIFEEAFALVSLLPAPPLRRVVLV